MPCSGLLPDGGNRSASLPLGTQPIVVEDSLLSVSFSLRHVSGEGRKRCGMASWEEPVSLAMSCLFTT